MTIASREAQIIRVRGEGIHPELSQTLSEQLRTAVIGIVKTVMEGAIEEGMREFLSQVEGKKAQRSGFYSRRLNTQYGSIEALQVPKIRQRNRERD